MPANTDTEEEEELRRAEQAVRRARARLNRARAERAVVIVVDSRDPSPEPQDTMVRPIDVDEREFKPKKEEEVDEKKPVVKPSNGLPHDDGPAV